MSVVSKPSIAFRSKRLAGALAAVSLCVLLGACGNDDDKTPDTRAAGSTDSSTSDSNTATALSANPSSVAPAPPAVTIQTPALPASSADPALSAAASTPLATPVIHTVD
ncbi:hypothetical protein R69927_03519 [Paraburkholderia domus]|uniref:Uncharacterized protein n=1 Tax=Paraburkholderia domus TaxID=2793075 RepID=A0A9N8N655_9BURK|nr:hypothetical protein [Paraburkholderia domus]MBK5046876.1 hypothetical protein [Burkholderia sp. R-70006]MBK5058720.1 hypothetical protein [Burkholderia sp. R-70199]MBK5087731.1 hypothetical protein [Burkholderia sp. R-69927]MBK5123389.1 hypothetical protein [Burkholderia sp. R-69980]MBK5162872.1 hypothetical protein [Burkholderia sp. R-70211]MBK5181374.1 hypothetical protein [Burkholderia sp. R-69749]MCI0151232.1 hypothetical protein [Paraburkholderia sediminicola]